MSSDDDEGVNTHAHRHAHADGSECHEDHGDDEDDDADPPSTGFLPLSLAITLFVSGLFVLGFVPGLQCG